MEKQALSVITGSNGFIGSHLAAYLLDKGHRVRCIVRESSNLKWLEGLDVEYAKCGLDDIGKLSVAFEDADYIYHLAGTTKAKKYEGYLYGNVQLARNVMEAAKTNPNIKRIVHTSSLAASAPSPLGKPATEKTPSNPISQYGKSKVEMEQMLHNEYSDLPYVIVRPPVVYGPRDTEVFLFFQTVAKGLVSVIGFNEKQVSLVYIDDLLQGLYLSATHENAIRQTYFFVSDTILKWKQVGKEAASILGKKTITLNLPHFLVFAIAAIAGMVNYFQKQAPTLNWDKAKEITKDAWTCSSDKAEQELGFKPKVNYQEGFKKTLDWYKKEGWI